MTAVTGKTPPNATTGVSFDSLRKSLEGDLIEPQSPEYDETRELWNGMIAKRPAAIAVVGNESDIQKVIRFATEQGLPLAVRGGGHNVAGTASVDGGLVLDLSNLNDVTVDPSTRRALVCGGARWADVDEATQEHCLAVPGGVVSDTGVGGLTLGGGIGWLRRKHGLTIDSLVGARLVTADGNVRVVSSDTDPDLLWALKGGGGNFGVISQFEFELHPAGPEVAVAFVLYRASDYRSILPQLRELMDDLPEELSPIMFFGTVPESDEFNDSIWNEGFLALLCPAIASDVETGWSLLEPLRELAEPMADMSETMGYKDVQAILDEDYPSGELRYYWKSINLPELTDEVIETLARLDEARPSPLSTIDIWIQGGAMARVPADATAFGDRSEKILIGVESNWESPDDDEANLEWARDTIEALRSVSSGREYLNFPGFLEDGSRTLEKAYGDNYQRLAEIKRMVDPNNLFSQHLNIKPAE